MSNEETIKVSALVRALNRNEARPTLDILSIAEEFGIYFCESCDKWTLRKDLTPVYEQRNRRIYQLRCGGCLAFDCIKKSPDGTLCFKGENWGLRDLTAGKKKTKPSA